MAKIDTWIELAELYYKAGAFEKAITTYQNIIKQGYRFGSVYNHLASAFTHQGNFQEAIPHYVTCIELLSDPRERALVSIQLGNCHRHLGDFDSALSALRKAFEIDPGNPAVMQGLADVQSDLEQSIASPAQPAETFSAGALKPEIQPTPAVREVVLAPVIVEPAAQPAAAASLSPDQDATLASSMHLTMAIMHWRSGNLADAENTLQTIINHCDCTPNAWLEALAWHVLAQVKTDQGHIPAAIGAYRQSLSLAPDHFYPWASIGRLYDTLGSNDEALMAFLRAVKQNPEDAGSWNGLGDIYTRLGRLDDGVAAYQLGNIFEKRPQVPDAITAYEKALALYNYSLEPHIGAVGEMLSPTHAVEIQPQPLGLTNQSIVDALGVIPFPEITPFHADPILAGEPPSAAKTADDSLAVSNPVAEPAAVVSLIVADQRPAASASTENTLAEPESASTSAETAPAPNVESKGLDAGDAPQTVASAKVETALPIKTESVNSAAENTGKPNDSERLSSAIASFLKVVEINPHNDKAWDSLGNLYRITQRINDAIYAFEKATSLDPNKYLYRYQLGTAYAAGGNYQSALAEIRRALELNPSFVYAHCAMASYLRKLDQRDEAQKHINLAAPLMMAQKEYDRACFESIRGNTTESLRLLQIALEKKQTTSEWIRRDLDLDFIRNDARFDKLAAGIPLDVIEIQQDEHK